MERKGGSGKTTLAGHLAVEAERQGAGPVALIDTDPQGSLAAWWNSRTAETPVFVETYVSRLTEDLGKLRTAGVQLVIIDTPPAITNTIVDVVRASDMVLIPVRPSPHDLGAAGATVDLVESLDKPLVFAINGASPRARITSEAVIALSQHGTLAPSIVHHRTDFAASMIDGRTVMELPRTDRSAAEITALWTYLARRLAGRERPSLATEMEPLQTAFAGQGA
jgi:chromosome partitioning protein